jgi:hypothetical protein
MKKKREYLIGNDKCVCKLMAAITTISIKRIIDVLEITAKKTKMH